jgi:hypothetical protein
LSYASDVYPQGYPGFPLLAALFALASCAPSDAPPAPPLSALTEVSAPAADGSAEPFLSSTDDGVVLSWLEPTSERSYALKVSSYRDNQWSHAVTVAERDDFFVNWADFPTVSQVAPGVLAAHWLQRSGGPGTYDYGVRVVHSSDAGRTWSEPWTPHDDGTPTEHGFVSFLPLADRAWGLVWLDGREFHAAEGAQPAEEMTLRFRSVGPEGVPGPEVLVDGRICDCCQTDAALTSRGPVVVYRDRSEQEIRDIYMTRWVNGAWTEGAPVHADDWKIDACPVNGPAVAARGDQVAVAWFTGAGDVPRVNVAFSGDAGAAFGSPVQVDDGNPAGRVDALMLEDGSALVSWLERTSSGQAEVRARRVWPEGRTGPAATVTVSSDARASGFPRMAALGDGSLLIAWTDAGESGTRVRVARAEIPER